MTLTSESGLTVFVYLPGALTAVPAGRLQLLEDERETLAAEFFYGTRYPARAEAIELDPVSLPFRPQRPLPRQRQVPVNGLPLFGAFRDAAPDAWGRRLIENRLQRSGPLPESVYLRHAGAHRTGALDFRPAPDSAEPQAASTRLQSLDYLMESIERIEAGERLAPAALAPLLEAGSSMGGARPKAVLLDDGRLWLAKFPLRSDRLNLPRVEMATLTLAAAAGLQVPAVRCVTLADGRDVLLIERFDRQAVAHGQARVHFVSALTLLGLHESEARQGSYAALADALSRYGAAGSVQMDRTELFGRMVFNILVSNDDDHLRNHGVLWSPQPQGWRLAPLYDVLPHPQVGHERFLQIGVGSQGRLATLDNALSACGRFGLTPAQAAAVIERITMTVRAWKNHFEAQGISGTDLDVLASAFRSRHELGWRAIAAVLG